MQLATLFAILAGVITLAVAARSLTTGDKYDIAADNSD
jgi:hypothetical protein